METNINPSEIPDGFTAADPTQASSSAGPDSKQIQKQAQEERKRSILEQSLTPEALARLGTIKVCIHMHQSITDTIKYVISFFCHTF